MVDSDIRHAVQNEYSYSGERETKLRLKKVIPRLTPGQLVLKDGKEKNDLLKEM